MSISPTLCVKRRHYIHQMNENTAILHGYIEEVVYILPPAGCRTTLNTGQKLKVLKGLCRLKQAQRLWYSKCTEVMYKLDFSGIGASRCIFRLGEVLVLLYVNYMTIIVRSMISIEAFKIILSSILEINFSRDLNDFHGVHFGLDRDGACTWQSHYVG